jgi:RNA polymerase sigma-70 factor (ECF subfamily)
MKRYSRKSQRDDPPVVSPSFEDAYPIMRRAAGARAAAVVAMYRLSSDEQSDLEQEAALQVWRSLGVFDPTRSSLKTFVERIVANQMASSIRRLRAGKRQASPDECTHNYVDCEEASI